MKYIHFFLLFFAGVLIPMLGSAQQQATSTVRFQLHNKSVLFSKKTLISYEPGKVGNSTIGLFFMPFQKKEFTFPVGTKLYLATTKQINVVMGGRRIDTEKPFLEVYSSTANTVIALR